MKENLPLELFEKHRAALGLVDPVVFDHENRLFEGFSSPVQNALVFLPKSKTLINMTLALVSGTVAEGGTVILAGTNNAGIRSARDLFEENIGPIDQKIVGNHSALYVGRNRRLGAGKMWRDFLSFSPLTYRDMTIEAAKLPGVFSAGELDEGTKLLLDNIPYDRAKVLDVGSGAGIIGTIYKKLAPKSDVTMSDSSFLAVRASEETLKKNKMEAQVALSDIFSSITGTFDLILCNPPFHTGVETDYSFIERFARDAKKHLAKGGEVYIVANAFLSYEDKLRTYIGPTDVVAENKKFKVLRARA